MARQTKNTKKSGKRGAPKKVAAAPKANPLFPPKPKNWRIGGDVQHKRDLSRFVRWPKYVRLQRQRKILMTRLKVPPAINQFKRALDRNQAGEVFKLLNKYKPETKAEKKERLRAAAVAKAEGTTLATEAPCVIKFGLNHVTTLVEQKKAQLVVIAHDVNPIELVVWLPALCRKMDVPYVIVKGKARLGTLLGLKNSAAICLTRVKPEDVTRLENIQTMARAQFNDATDVLRRWGGGIMGLKTQQKLAKREAARALEEAKKSKL